MSNGDLGGVGLLRRSSKMLQTKREEETTFFFVPSLKR